ncbi:hypothetical protein PALB_14030 [Pseudoalteromonas luteoviolacea B = ATCC 29581]|nr:hypothetical protein PALB_14030 [Pseudoalteromonas luteoviolacea B = ATCC 29581]
MLFKGLGLMSVLSALFSLPLCLELGANSVISFYLVLASMLVAALSSAASGKKYFIPTFLIACINVLILNDGTKLIQVTADSDLLYVFSMYGIFIVVAGLSFVFARQEIEDFPSI